MATMPYNQYSCGNQPSASAKKEAKYFRATEPYRIDKRTGDVVTKIKAKLAGGCPVITVVEVRPDFNEMSASNQIYDDITRTYANGSSYHCIVITGYDDSNRTFKFINSWGARWCDNGYGYIAYSIVPTDVVPELYTMEDVGLKGTFPNKSYVELIESNGQYLQANAKSKWIEDRGNYFYFDSNGTQLTNWLFESNQWYYFNPNTKNVAKGLEGVMSTRWALYDSQWYFLRYANDLPKKGGPLGSMCVGWIKDKDAWYYLRTEKDTPKKGGPKGSMCTGWLMENDEWYYLRPRNNYPNQGLEGSMYTGWLTESGETYYFRTAPNVPNAGEFGSMLADTSVKIDGKLYHFDKDGKCLNYNK